MEYQAIAGSVQMRVLEGVMQMVLNSALLALVLIVGLIVCRCVFESRQSRPGRPVLWKRSNDQEGVLLPAGAADQRGGVSSRPAVVPPADAAEAGRVLGRSGR